jgi:hypothetical protein
MKQQSTGKGVDPKSKETFLSSSTDFTYKGLVLENYNVTKSILVGTAQDRFSKEKVAGCYIATKSLADMILPYIREDKHKLYVMQNKNNILKYLGELEREYLDIWGMDVSDRADYVRKCTEVVGNLVPLFSFVGLYVKTTSRGVFYAPDSKKDRESK